MVNVCYAVTWPTSTATRTTSWRSRPGGVVPQSGLEAGLVDNQTGRTMCIARHDGGRASFAGSRLARRQSRNAVLAVLAGRRWTTAGTSAIGRNWTHRLRLGASWAQANPNWSSRRLTRRPAACSWASRFLHSPRLIPGWQLCSTAEAMHYNHWLGDLDGDSKTICGHGEPGRNF